EPAGGEKEVERVVRSLALALDDRDANHGRRDPPGGLDDGRATLRGDGTRAIYHPRLLGRRLRGRRSALACGEQYSGENCESNGLQGDALLPRSSSGYRAPIRYKPSGGAGALVSELTVDSSKSAISVSGRRRRPTSTIVPTRNRTMR